jgi:hypothetical protein
MITMRIKTHVRNDRQVILTLPPEVPTGPAELVVTVDSDDSNREARRLAALDRYLALARGSSFRSVEPYPSRDELHERD